MTKNRPLTHSEGVNMERLPSFKSGQEALNYAHQCRYKHLAELAISAFREAARLFGKDGNRKEVMKAFSWQLTIKRKLANNQTEEHEQDLLLFLERYRDFINEKGYLLCKYNYLIIQINKRSKQNENYPIMEGVLQKLAKVVEDNRDIFPWVPIEQINIWKAQAKIAASNSTPDIMKRSQLYREAAALSLLPEGSSSTLAQEMNIKRVAFLSEAEKLMAFWCVRRERNDLSGAIAHMKQAIEHAQLAKQLDLQNYDLQPHYLSYWFNVFSARKSVEKNDFQEALQYLDQAVTEVNHFNEDDLFPNYFANKTDLLQERLLVEAYIAFSEKQFVNTSVRLNTWLKTMKEDLKGSWKYSNVAVRKILADVLSKELSPPSANDVEDSIKKAGSSIRFGKACNKLADFAAYVAYNAEGGLLTKNLYDEIVNKCIPLFPLSSQTESRFSFSFFNREPYDELPVYFKEWLREAEYLKAEASVRELYRGLKTYLIVICDYYYQKRAALQLKGVQVKPLPTDFKNNFLNMDIDNLAVVVILLLKSIGKRPKGRPKLVDWFQGWLKEYIQLYSQFSKRQDAEVVKKMIQLVKDKLIGQTYIDIFPLVINIARLITSENKLLEYETQVLWQRPDAEKMVLKGKKVFDVNEYYYLKPHWKNFYHGVQDSNHHSFETYKASMFEGSVITEYHELLKRRSIHELQWRHFEFPAKITEFEKIVASPPRETQIEHFLQENKWLLGPYYTKLHVEKRLQEDSRLDIFCTRYDGGQDIWEIKLPSVRLFNVDLSKTSKLNKSLEQLANYQRELRENALPIFWQKQIRIRDPSGFLLIGRDAEFSHDERKKLSDLNSEIKSRLRTVLTYDDLIRRAKVLIETLRGTKVLPIDSHIR